MGCYHSRHHGFLIKSVSMNLELHQHPCIQATTATIKLVSIIVQCAIVVERQLRIESIQRTDGEHRGAHCFVCPLMGVGVLNIDTVVGVNLAIHHRSNIIVTIIISILILEIIVSTDKAVDHIHGMRGIIA